MLRRPPYDVVVVGLGLAGMTAGLAAAEQGAQVLVVGKGYGTTHFRSGTIDVLGYVEGRQAGSPRQSLPGFVAAHPDHPYALVGDQLEPALDLLRAATSGEGLALRGGLDANQLVATSAGTLRPTCLAPRSLAGRWAGARVLAAGFEGYRDFDPELFAAVFPTAAGGHDLDVTVRATRLALPQRGRRHLDGMSLARLFEQRTFRAQVIEEIEPQLADATLVAFPAVLGLDRAAAVHDELERALGIGVVELPTLPPSVPGMRLQRALEAALRRRGARVQVGARARLERWRGRATMLEVASAAHPTRITLRAVVLAAGGLAGGGLQVEPEGAITETVAGLPVATAPGSSSDEWFRDAFLGPVGQAAGLAGLKVDERMRPLLVSGSVAGENVFAAGGLLAGAQRPVERSADGLACVTGYVAGREAAA